MNRKLLRCHFCDKSIRQVKQMMEGTKGINICKPCVEIAQEIWKDRENKLEEENKKEGVRKSKVNENFTSSYSFCNEIEPLSWDKALNAKQLKALLDRLPVHIPIAIRTMASDGLWATKEGSISIDEDQSKDIFILDVF